MASLKPWRSAMKKRLRKFWKRGATSEERAVFALLAVVLAAAMLMTAWIWGRLVAWSGQPNGEVPRNVSLA